MPNYFILIQFGETHAARMQPIRERHCLAIRYGIIFGAWKGRLSQSETIIPWSWMINYHVLGKIFHLRGCGGVFFVFSCNLTILIGSLQQGSKYVKNKCRKVVAQNMLLHEPFWSISNKSITETWMYFMVTNWWRTSSDCISLPSRLPL